MTEMELQTQIKNVLSNDILKDLQIFKDKEIQIFLHDIPMSRDFEDEEEKYFPCCIVRCTGAEIKTASDPQTINIEIIVMIKDWSEDMSGYQNLMIVIDRIKDYFMKNGGIHNQFRIKYPLKWDIIEEAATPYYAAVITTVWNTDVMPYADIEKFL